MFRFTQKPSSGGRNLCLAKITGMVPAYLLICFVASAMAAYSNLYTVLSLSKSKQNLVMVLYFIYFKATTCFGPYSGSSSGHSWI